MTGTRSAPVEDWDLVVVGAGPAGSAAALGALAADPSSRVLLLDRAAFPRDKSCGDGLAPHVLDVLAEVGVHDLVQGWTPLRRLSLVRGSSAVDGEMARPAWVVPREVLDARLVERAVAAGAVLRRHRVRDVRTDGDDDGSVALDDRFRAPVVVGADGAHSVVRAAAGLSAPGRQALAIRGYAPTPEHRRGRQVIVYGGHRQPSYAWSFDRGDGFANVGYGEGLARGAATAPPTRAAMLAELERLLPGTASTGGRWRGHHLPLSSHRWDQPGGRLLLAGDAAHLVNPLTGEGIYYAVATGVLAGRAVVESRRRGRPASAGALHRGAVRRLLGTHLRHTWAASGVSASTVLGTAGITAAAASSEVFDDLVELGLGRGHLTPAVLRGTAGGLLRPRS